MTEGRFRPNYRLPNRIQRMRGAVALFTLYAIVLVAVPLVAIHFVTTYGVSVRLPLLLIVGGGAAIAVLSSWAEYRKPTSGYGPLRMVASGATLVYVLALVYFASISFQGTVEGHPIALNVGYAGLLYLIAILPLLGLLSGLFLTLQDRSYPGKRLLKDYPVR